MTKSSTTLGHRPGILQAGTLYPTAEAVHQLLYKTLSQVAPASRRDLRLIAFRCARLNCEVVASSSWWLVPPDGRHACGRCRAVSGVTLALAFTATQHDTLWSIHAPEQRVTCRPMNLRAC